MKLLKNIPLLAGVGLLLVLAGFTVLNKGWWIRRVNRKWQIAVLPNATGDDPWTVKGQDLTKLSLTNLWAIYRGGAPGWSLKSELAAQGEPQFYTNANGSVDYTRYADGSPVPLG